MASLITSGASGNLIKYTDDSGNEMRIVIAHIVSYFDSGSSAISIGTIKEDHKFMFDDQAAVDNAVTLLDGKF